MKLPFERSWLRQQPSLLAAMCVVAALIGGCAAPASYEGMVPAKFDGVKKHTQTVSLAVTGGKETDSGGTPQISDDAFREALAASIKNSQVFSGVVEGKGGDYLLTVSLFGMQQPIFGLDMTVTLEAAWTLHRASGGAPVWRESIKSAHTATVGDAFVAATRLRLATEGAAKNNIEQGLAKLSRLNL